MNFEQLVNLSLPLLQLLRGQRVLLEHLGILLLLCLRLHYAYLLDDFDGVLARLRLQHAMLTDHFLQQLHLSRLLIIRALTLTRRKQLLDVALARNVYFLLFVAIFLHYGGHVTVELTGAHPLSVRLGNSHRAQALIQLFELEVCLLGVDSLAQISLQLLHDRVRFNLVSAFLQVPFHLFLVHLAVASLALPGELRVLRLHGLAAEGSGDNRRFSRPLIKADQLVDYLISGKRQSSLGILTVNSHRVTLIERGFRLSFNLLRAVDAVHGGDGPRQVPQILMQFCHVRSHIVAVLRIETQHELVPLICILLLKLR